MVAHLSPKKAPPSTSTDPPLVPHPLSPNSSPKIFPIFPKNAPHPAPFFLPTFPHYPAHTHASARPRNTLSRVHSYTLPLFPHGGHNATHSATSAGGRVASPGQSCTSTKKAKKLKKQRVKHLSVLHPSAERGGFEPPVLFNAVRPFSKRVLSASQPPLQMLCAANDTSSPAFRQHLFVSFSHFFQKNDTSRTERTL